MQVVAQLRPQLIINKRIGAHPPVYLPNAMNNFFLCLTIKRIFESDTWPSNQLPVLSLLMSYSESFYFISRLTSLALPTLNVSSDVAQ